MLSRFPRPSLGTRLAILGLATLCPIIALTLYSYVSDRHDRRNEAVRDATTYSESVATGFEQFAEGLESLTLAAALAMGDQQEPISQPANQHLLERLTSQNPLYRAIFVTDLDGRVVAQGTGEGVGRDLSERVYVQALQRGAETVWSGGFEGLDSGRLVVAFGRRITNPNGTPRAFLFVAFYPANLAEQLGEPSAFDGHIVLIDDAGQVLTSSKPDDLGREAATIRADPLVGRALAGEQVVFSSTDTPFDDDARFGTITPLPTMGWALAFTRSQSKLDASLTRSLTRDLTILGVISFASVLAMLLIARQVSRPLSALTASVSRVEEGQFPELPPPTSDPDVARLQRSIASMTAAVVQREQQLAEQARTLDTLETVGLTLASELDLARTVQAVTSAGGTLLDADRAEFSVLPSESDPMPNTADVLESDRTADGMVRLATFVRTSPSSGGDDWPSRIVTPVSARNGEPLGQLVFLHHAPDHFTERHLQLAEGIAAWGSIALANARLYQAATDAQQALLEAAAAKDEFMGMVSHELRTPITVLVGGISQLSRNLALLSDEDRTALLGDLQDSAQRLSQLVTNILTLARLDRLHEFDTEDVPLGTVVERLCRQHERRWPEREVILARGEESMSLTGSRLYIEQVVTNLLTNAQKYSPTDQPIEVSIATENKTALISVADRGPGLSEADQRHLFEPYYRGLEAQRRASGFGLGLAVCKRLALAMGGDLVYEDRPGGGARFTLALPVFTESAPSDEHPVGTPGA